MPVTEINEGQVPFLVGEVITALMRSNLQEFEIAWLAEAAPRAVRELSSEEESLKPDHDCFHCELRAFLIKWTSIRFNKEIKQ